MCPPALQDVEQERCEGFTALSQMVSLCVILLRANLDVCGYN